MEIEAQNPRGPIVVTGKVVDVNNEPLPGVSVTLKGTIKGATMTDSYGNYSLSISNSKSTIQFSYIGFSSVEFQITKSQVLNVSLTESNQQLNDVMVIGYGSIRKRDVTGAINSISSDAIEQKTPTNIFEAMQGQTAGLQVITGSGAPGESADIHIRGVSTFEGGAKPLYVVDGVVYDAIDDLNPSDIQSIEILKDAASASIYGSRSANGVILISTKQGDKTKPRIDVNYIRSYSALSHHLPKTNSAERKYYDKIRYGLTGGLFGYVIKDTLSTFNNQDLDLQNLLFRTAERNQIDVSASGASDAFKYFVSAAFLNENGIIVNSDYNRLTTRINTEYKSNKKFTMGSKIQFSVGLKNGISEDGVLTQLLERPPYWGIFNPDGSYVPNISSRRNPYAVAMTDVNKNQSYKASLYEYFEYQIGSKIKLNASIQGSYLNNRSQFYRNSAQLSTTERTTGRDTTGLYYNFANENYITYKDKIGSFNNISIMIGNSVQYWGQENINLVGLDYSSDIIYTLNSASFFDTRKTFTSLSNHTMASFYGRLSYDYKGKYLFNSNLRYDGSSRFGSQKKWGLFPSISGGWRFSDEKFMNWSKNVIADGKVRVSWGVTGNQEIGNYDSYQLYSPNYMYNGISGIAASNLAYNELSWEQTTQYNIGLDLNMFDNKLKATFDYYKKNTDGLLSKIELPKETGFQTIRKNVGSMTNEGYEFSFDYNVVRTKKISWSISFNIATNNSKITQIADGIPFYKGLNDAIYVQENSRLGEFYGYKNLGIFSYNESNAFSDTWNRLTPVFLNGVFQNQYLLNGTVYTGVVNQKKSSSGNILKGGDIDFYDANGDGIINVSDKQLLGCAQPDFFGGFNTSLTYSDFSLFIAFNYSIGGKIYNYAEAKRNAFTYDGSTPSPIAIDNMWTKPGDNVIYAAPINSENNSLAPQDFYLEDASYVKLSNVKLSYDLPTKFIKTLFINKLSVYVYGNNLLTFTNYKGYDPEFSSGGDPLTLGIDPARYPRKREYGFGINIRF